MTARRRNWLALLAALLLPVALARPAAAHPASAVAAKLDVGDDGTFRLRVTFDLPAFAVNERPADVSNQLMLDLLDKPDDEVKRYLDDAGKRFAHHLKLFADGRALELSSVGFPAVADLRKLDNRDAKAFQRLPIIADATATGRLPAGTLAVSLRLAPVLGDVVLTAEVPGREPQGQLVKAGEASEPMPVAPPTSRPAESPATRPTAKD